MRIRSIKPEFWRSEDVTRLPFDLRLLFIGLWSYVDDNGVGIDDHRRVTADLFALEDDQARTRVFVSEGLRRLSLESLITRYMINNRSYLFINTWSAHQRVPNPNRPRYPLPSGEVAHPTSAYRGATDGLTTVYVDPNEGLGTGTGEQGNRGTGEETSSPGGDDVTPDVPTTPRTRTARPSDSADFIKFWETYPRQVGKGEARKAWAKVIKTADPADIIAGAARYRDDPERRRKGLEFTKHPGPWLNAERWTDELETLPINGRPFWEN